VIELFRTILAPPVTVKFTVPVEFAPLLKFTIVNKKIQLLITLPEFKESKERSIIFVTHHFYLQ